MSRYIPLPESKTNPDLQLSREKQQGWERSGLTTWMSCSSKGCTRCFVFYIINKAARATEWTKHEVTPVLHMDTTLGSDHLSPDSQQRSIRS